MIKRKIKTSASYPNFLFQGKHVIYMDDSILDIPHKDEFYEAVQDIQN